MIYFLQSGLNGPIKIGYTEDDISKRVSALQTGNPQKIMLLNVMEGTRETESNFHKKFKKHRISGEWFSPSLEIIAFINQTSSSANLSLEPGTLDEKLAKVETECILISLENNNFNYTKTAEDLGLSMRSLRYRIEKNGIREITTNKKPPAVKTPAKEKPWTKK